VNHAEQALADGNPEQAVKYIKAALRLAPLRQDLKGLLSEALEAQATRRSESGPIKRVRTSNRPPLFQDPESRSSSPAEIEEIRTAPPDYEAEEEPQVVRRPAPARPAETYRNSAAPSAPARSRTMPPRRPAQRRSSPAAAWLLGVSFGLLVAFAGAAGIWFFVIRSHSRVEGGQAGVKPGRNSNRQDMELMNQAQTYIDQRQYSLARERLEKIGDESLRHRQLAKTFALEGSSYLNDQNFEMARRSYEQALDADPTNEQYAREMGGECYVLGRKKQGEGDAPKSKELFARAEQAYKATLTVNPNSLVSLEGLGKLEAARGNPPAAGEYFRKIIQVDPNSEKAASARKQLRDMGLKG